MEEWGGVGGGGLCGEGVEKAESAGRDPFPRIRSESVPSASSWWACPEWRTRNFAAPLMVSSFSRLNVCQDSSLSQTIAHAQVWLREQWKIVHQVKNRFLYHISSQLHPK